MNFKKSLFALLLIFAISSNVFSQSVDDVINNYIKAVGGMDKISAIKTLKITGKFSGMGADIPITFYIKRADEKVKMEMSFQGMSMMRTYDGKIGWSINPFSGKKDAEKMPADETKSMKEQADFEGRLVNYKDKGYKAELLGKEDMEGSEVYKIKMTDKDGDVTMYFLDATSYLILKETAKRKMKEKEIVQDSYPSNYQSVEGYMFPMSMEFKSPGSDDSQKATFDKVETNVEIDDAIFKMPEPTK